MVHLRVTSLSFFHFSISFLLTNLCFFFFFYVFLSIFSLQALVSEFNCRCFLHSRCSMEMWCHDDIGRDS